MNNAKNDSIGDVGDVAGVVLFVGLGREDTSDGLTRDNCGKVEAGVQGNGGAPFIFSACYGVLVDSNGGAFSVAPGCFTFAHAVPKEAYGPLPQAILQASLPAIFLSWSWPRTRSSLRYTSPMTRAWKRWTLAPLACLVVFALWGLLHRSFHRHSSNPAALRAPIMQHEPLTMLWAWETPEDLTTLDPSKTGVAFLSRELLLGTSVQIRPRRQPLRVARNTWLMAVVRIETASDFTPNATIIADVARAIGTAAQQPNVRAVQVDFDATTSQRSFYTAVLNQLRPQLPPNTPLSITALVSWCGDNSWLHLLPVDEAVPMFFRMGGPATIRAIRPKDASLVHEPVCSGSVGISTDETWPAIHNQQRVYVFLPGFWTQQDLARVNALGYHGLAGDSHR